MTHTNPMKCPTKTIAASLLICLLAGTQPSSSATLNAEAVRGFEQYVEFTQNQIDDQLRSGGAFLWIDSLASARRREVDTLLRRGEVVSERVERPVGAPAISTLGALIHHWTGIVFIPGVSLRQVLGVVQDYDKHQQYYAPQVVRSRIIERTGDHFKIYLRLKQVKVITVVFDTQYDVEYEHVDARRAQSRSYSTSIRQVEHAGEPSERAMLPGEDQGLLWRLDSFWHFAETAEGVYVQCEAVSLTRDIPRALSIVIKPLVSAIPRQSLEFTLKATRTAVLQNIRGITEYQKDSR